MPSRFTLSSATFVFSLSLFPGPLFPQREVLFFVQFPTGFFLEFSPRQILHMPTE